MEPDHFIWGIGSKEFTGSNLFLVLSLVMCQDEKIGGVTIHDCVVLFSKMRGKN